MFTAVELWYETSTVLTAVATRSEQNDSCKNASHEFYRLTYILHYGPMDPFFKKSSFASDYGREINVGV